MWTEKGVPHKDWTCLEVYDLGEATHTCDMCNKEQIRYVHVMRHSTTGDKKQVGCVCAAAMALESVGDAKERERGYKNMFKRRETFMKKWLWGSYSREFYKTASKDFYTLCENNKGGFRIKTWIRGEKRLIGMNNRFVGEKEWGSARLFSTATEAKYYVFEVLEGRVVLS